MKLDGSTENVLLEEDMRQGKARAKIPGKISHRVKARVRMILCQEKERTRMFGRKIQCRAKISRKKIRSSLLPDEAEFPYYIKSKSQTKLYYRIYFRRKRRIYGSV